MSFAIGTNLSHFSRTDVAQRVEQFAAKRNELLNQAGLTQRAETVSQRASALAEKVRSSEPGSLLNELTSPETMTKVAEHFSSRAERAESMGFPGLAQRIDARSERVANTLDILGQRQEPDPIARVSSFFTRVEDYLRTQGMDERAAAVAERGTEKIAALEQRLGQAVSSPADADRA